MEKGWTFVCNFGEKWEIWKKGNERILYDPDENKIILHYLDD